MIGWVVVVAEPGGASLRPVPLAHPTHPLRGGAGWGFKTQKASPPAGPFSRRVPGFRGCCCWRGGLGFGVVGSVVCSLLGRAPEAIRNLSGGQAAGGCRWCGVGSRRLTSRQDPDRASPARPRREHTPRGSVWAAPGPGSGGPVAPDVEIYIRNSRPIPESRGD